MKSSHLARALVLDYFGFSSTLGSRESRLAFTLAWRLMVDDSNCRLGPRWSGWTGCRNSETPVTDQLVKTGLGAGGGWGALVVQCIVWGKEEGRESGTRR